MSIVITVVRFVMQCNLEGHSHSAMFSALGRVPESFQNLWTVEGEILYNLALRNLLCELTDNSFTEFGTKW